MPPSARNPRAATGLEQLREADYSFPQDVFVKFQQVGYRVWTVHTVKCSCHWWWWQPASWSNWNTSIWNTYLKYVVLHLYFVFDSVWTCIWYFKYILYCNLYFEYNSEFSAFLFAKTANSHFKQTFGTRSITNIPHFKLIGKSVFDFLLVIIQLFQSLHNIWGIMSGNLSKLMAMWPGHS